MRTVTFYVVPAYILWAAEDMILTIMTSPSGIKLDPFTRPRQLEAIQFSSSFLGNLFNSIIFGVLVALGYSRYSWQLEPKNGVMRAFVPSE